MASEFLIRFCFFIIICSQIVSNNGQSDNTCSSTGSVRLSSNYSTISMNNEQQVEQINGYIQICVNGMYLHLCGIENVTDIVRTACNQLEYYNESSYDSYNPSSLFAVISNVSCPYDGAALSSCYYNTTMDGLCNSFNGSKVYATCTRNMLPESYVSDMITDLIHNDKVYQICNIMSNIYISGVPTCDGGNYLYSLEKRSSFSFANGTFIYTGRVEICIGNVYYPVCNSDSGYPNSEDLNGVCGASFGNFEMLPNQYIGNLSDYYANESSVITSIVCPPGQQVCNYTLGTHCINSSEIVISCITISNVIPTQPPMCSNGHVKLENFTEYSSVYGATYKIGRVETCYNNEYISVCRDTPYVNSFARRACGSTDYTIIPYDPVYSDARSNLNIVLDYCTDGINYYSSWSNVCNWTISTGQCSSEPLTVRCDYECDSFGLIRMTQFNVSYHSNGTTGITGNAEFCDTDHWNSICRGSLNEYAVSVFCRELGYNNGTLVSVNPNGSGFTNRYANLSCPNYQYSRLLSCSLRQDNVQCTNNSDGAVIHCYNNTKICYGNQYQFSNGYYGAIPVRGQFPNGSNYAIGSIEICINGNFTDVCNDTLTHEIATLYCASLSSGYTIGYPYALYNDGWDVSFDYNANGIYNISCPPGLSYPYLSSCTYNVTVGNGCSAHGGPAVITCVEGIPSQPTCTGNGVTFHNRGAGTLINGTNFIIGRPQRCINNTLTPFCASLSYDEAVILCSNSISSYVARTYPIIGRNFDFGYDTSASFIVNNFTCPVDSEVIADCSVETSSDDIGCAGNDSLITCIELPKPCPQFDTVLNYIAYDSSNFPSYSILYSVDLCYDFFFGTLCADGVTDSIANLLCTKQGATFGAVATDYNSTVTSSYNRNYTNLSCPSDANSLSSCYNNVSSVSGCNTGRLIIRCTHVYVPPTCYYNGQAVLDNPINYTLDGVSYLIGRPTVCVNNFLHPICNATVLGPDAINTYCFDNNYPYGTAGSPPGAVIPNISSITNTSLVVTEFECFTPYNCSHINVSEDVSCSALGNAYATISCARVCVDASLRFINEYTEVINGTNYTIGVPQGCVAGAYSELCNDKAVSSNAATLFCQLLGFQGGLSYPANQTINPIPNTVYYTNFSCADNASYVTDCRADITTDPVCLSGQLRYAVACYHSSISSSTSTAVSSSVVPSSTTTSSSIVSSSVVPSSTTTSSSIVSSSVVPSSTTTSSSIVSSSVVSSSTTTSTSISSSSSVVQSSSLSVTSSFIPPLETPKTILDNGLKISLDEFTADTFNVSHKMTFKETVAVSCNNYCSSNPQSCVGISISKRQSTWTPISADDVVIVSITDTSSGIEVITYVLVSSNNILPLDAFMEATEDAINSGVYEAAGFSSVTAEPIAQPTETPTSSGIDAGAIAAIVISILLLGAMLALVIIVFMIIFTRNSKRQHYRYDITDADYVVSNDNAIAIEKISSSDTTF